MACARTSSFSRRAPSEAPGEITWGEVFAVLPFGNRTTILTLTGDQLTAGSSTASRRSASPAIRRTGRFPQVSGLKVQFHCDGTTPVVDNMWKAPTGSAAR